MKNVWRLLSVALFVLLAHVGRVRVTEGLAVAQRAYTRAVAGGVSSAPLGWKLEPRLSSALNALVAFYARFHHMRLWTPALVAEVPLAVASAGLTWMLLTGSPRGLAAALVFVVLLSEAAAALLAFLSRRLLVLHTQMLLSLAGLFRSRFYSVLRGRQESHAPSLDAVLLGLLVFAAALLLYPVVLLHTAFLVAVSSPAAVAVWLFRRS
jgi:hypothetical protein